MTDQAPRSGSDRFSLQGKVAWVAGAGGHLGPAICRGLAEHGAHVVIADIRPQAAEELARTLLGEDLSCETQTLDVGQEEAVIAAADDIVARHSRLDVLVNLTYGSTGKLMEQMSLAEWEQGTRLTLGAAFVLSREAGRVMAARGSGSIIHFASMYALVSPNPDMYPAGLNPNPVDYGAAKAGVLQLTRYQAVMWAKKGVRVNAVVPGTFPAPTRAWATGEFRPRLLERVPMGRIGQPEEIVGPVIFLASGASSFVTGTSIVVDGGWTAV